MQNNAWDGPLPPLRPSLEAVPIQQEGEQMVLLRDTEESTDAFMLSPAGMLLVSLLDGVRTATDLKRQFTQRTGLVLQDSEIQNLMEQLEKTDLLETPATHARRQARLQAFLQSAVRPAVHSRGGYPSDRLELTAFLSEFFKDPKGPGKPRSFEPVHKNPPLGLLAPHIDFRRGGPAYAWAYGALSEYPIPDVIVALGVAHVSPNSPWVMTPKVYETPFGAMPVHAELSAEIQKTLWYDAREEELVHRREHSLEFQAVWLKYLWGDKAPPWVPILTSSFERFAANEAPSSYKMLETALKEIGALLKRRADAGERILILGGIDLAHVGPRFGDEIELGAEMEKKIEDADSRSLEQACALKADSFYLAGVGEHRWRKVCGLSATYTALRWIQALDSKSSGQLLTYGQAPDPLGGVVSFTSILFD